MSFGNIMWAVFIAFGFGGWGIIGARTGASAGWIAMIVMAVGTAGVLINSFGQLTAGLPSWKATSVLLAVAVINAIAVGVYARKLTDPAIPTAVLNTVVFVSMVILTPVLDWILNGTVPTPKQGIGYMLAVVAIYFLNKT